MTLVWREGREDGQVEAAGIEAQASLQGMSVIGRPEPGRVDGIPDDLNPSIDRLVEAILDLLLHEMAGRRDQARVSSKGPFERFAGLTGMMDRANSRDTGRNGQRCGSVRRRIVRVNQVDPMPKAEIPDPQNRLRHREMGPRAGPVIDDDGGSIATAELLFHRSRCGD